ncbi:MAG: hypothetical protein OXH76_12350, partial [Boseongicola sp.]|nr:hypothetical protein [Boseongicola sp.]
MASHWQTNCLESEALKVTLPRGNIDAGQGKQVPWRPFVSRSQASRKRLVTIDQKEGNHENDSSNIDR